MMAPRHEAKETGADHITVWGASQARRELLYVDDWPTPSSSPRAITPVRTTSTSAQGRIEWDSKPSLSEDSTTIVPQRQIPVIAMRPEDWGPWRLVSGTQEGRFSATGLPRGMA
jgi:hypothetical protein